MNNQTEGTNFDERAKALVSKELGCLADASEPKPRRRTSRGRALLNKTGGLKNVFVIQEILTNPFQL